MAQTSYPTIPIKPYRFYYQSAGAWRLPEYPGSAWRGTFGHALKKTVCVVRNTPCGQCMLKHACAYSDIFETPPPAGSEKMRKYTATPHPFVFRFPDNPSDEMLYSLDLTPFGHGQRFFPYVVHAMQTAGRDGIGGLRQVFELVKIDEADFQGNTRTVYQHGELQPQQQAAFPPVPSMPAQVQLIFHSPLRIKRDQKNLSPGDFNFGWISAAHPPRNRRMRRPTHYLDLKVMKGFPSLKSDKNVTIERMLKRQVLLSGLSTAEPSRQTTIGFFAAQSIRTSY